MNFLDVPYNLRNQSKCSRNMPCTKKHDIKTASFTDPKLWHKVPTEIKNSKSLKEFKPWIKSWVPKNCNLFIKHVGYLLFMSHFSLFVFSFYKNNSDAFFIFFSFNCEQESKQSNFILSCYWDPYNGARIIYSFIHLFAICSSFIFLTLTGRNEIALVIFMDKKFFKSFLIVSFFKVRFFIFF